MHDIGSKLDNIDRKLDRLTRLAHVNSQALADVIEYLGNDDKAKIAVMSLKLKASADAVAKAVAEVPPH